MKPLNKRLARHTELYFSVDIEADGPIPGPYSMSSLGACVAGEGDGKRFRRRDPESSTFYRELKPISDDFVPEAARVSGLDRKKLIRNGDDPSEAMRNFDEWVTSVARGRQPVFVAWPLGFDWMWVYWYLRKFHTSSPFGHSSCLDMKTIYHRLRNTTLEGTSKSRLPEDLRSTREHTHNALDDAMEQADLFANMLMRDPRVTIIK